MGGGVLGGGRAGKGGAGGSPHPPHFENRSLSLSLVVLVTGTLPTNTVRCNFSSSSSGLGCEGGGGEVHTIPMRGGEAGEGGKGGKGRITQTLSFPFLGGWTFRFPCPEGEDPD